MQDKFKKVMVVVWKWNLAWRKERGENWIRDTENDFCDFIGKGNSKFEVNVNNSEDLKFIGFTKNNRHPQADKYKINTIQEECKKLAENNQVLLLLHGGGEDKFNENSTLYNVCEKMNNVVVDYFMGGDGIIYNHILDQGSTYFREDAINNPKSKKLFSLQQEKFNKVWDHYYGEEGKESPAQTEKKKVILSQKKNYLIKLWLPLAIDIQGLSEVKNSVKIEYLNEIKKDFAKINIKQYFIEPHDEIINKLIENIEDEDKKNHFKKFKINDENSDYSELSNLEIFNKTEEDINEEKIEYLTNSESDYFLPKFLCKLVNKINTLINK